MMNEQVQVLPIVLQPAPFHRISLIEPNSSRYVERHQSINCWVDMTEEHHRSSGTSVGSAESQISAEKTISIDSSQGDFPGEPSIVQPKDVLCGRDRKAHNHPGNKRFRTIVQSYRQRYQNAPRREDKNRITTEIIQLVLREGGRFLRVEEGTGEWVLVDAAGAHDKVSHALRSAKEPRRTRGVISEDGELSFATPHEQAKFRTLSSMQQSIFEELMKSEQLSDDGSSSGTEKESLE